MQTTTEPQLRSGAIGFALAVALAGVFHAGTTVSLTMMMGRNFSFGIWEAPRWAMAAALVLMGLAGVIAGASRRSGSLAAVLAAVSAIGVVGAALWSINPALAGGIGTSWLSRGWIASHVVLALLIAAAGWVWVRRPAGPVRAASVALGAVVGVAATELPTLVEHVALLQDPRFRSELSLVSGWTVAAALLMVAAVLAVVALVDRMPVGVVAGVVAVAGLLLLVDVARGATSLPSHLSDGGLRVYASTALGLAVALGRALLVAVLGVVLGACALKGSRSRRPYGAGHASAHQGPPAP